MMMTMKAVLKKLYKCASKDLKKSLF